MKEITENQLYTLMGKAVVNGLVVKSNATAREYTPTELWALNTKTLDALYENIPSPSTKRKRNTDKNEDATSFEAQADLIDAILSWRENEDARKEAEKAKRKADDKTLYMLSKNKDKAEEERISKLTQEQLDAEIAAIMLSRKEQFI